MDRLRWLLFRLRTALRRHRHEQDLDDELRFHLEAETNERIEAGLPPAAAHLAARRSLGNTALIREETRMVSTWTWLEQIALDVRYGARQLRLSPGFTSVAVLSLALGIGANTAIFQLVDVIRLRALPVRAPEQLALVKYGAGSFISGNYAGRNNAITHPQFLQLSARQQAFDGLLAFGTARFNLARGGPARMAEGLYVSGQFFAVLGVRPLLGRTSTAQDDAPPCPVAGAVLSHAFWQREYGGDPGAVGRTITLDGHGLPVIGVMPPWFVGVEAGRRFDVAVPLCVDALWSADGRGRLGDRSFWWLTVMGRLRPGWAVARATAHLRGISPDIMRESLPEGHQPDQAKALLANRLEAVPAAAGVSDLRSSYENPLWILLGTAGLVLLIACANLANLLLARGAARQREMAVRQALGGSRLRLISQVLAESALLAGLGGTLGVLLAQALNRSVVALISTPNDPIHVSLGLDWRVLAFTAAVTGLTCLLFGLLPAMRTASVAPTEAMRGGGRGATAGPQGVGLRRALVAGQVALSLVLLIGALLFARSLHNLSATETGFRSKGVLAGFVDLGQAGVAENRRTAVFEELRRRIARSPGAASAAMVAIPPLSGAGWNEYTLPDTDRSRQGGKLIWFNRVSEGYLRTMDTRLVAGRDFNDRDTLKAPPVAIINETCARKLFGSTGAALGRRLRTLGDPKAPEREYEVVGLVQDTKYRELREEFLPTVFLSFSQEEKPFPGRGFVVRVAGPADGVLAAIRDEAAKVDSRIGMQFRFLDVQVRDSLRTDQLLALLSGGFGVLAGVLSTVGLYGVVSYLAARRRNEIGIRMALGADRPAVVRLVLGDAGRMVMAGVMVGLLLAMWAGRAASSLLFGLKPHDPATLAGAAVLLALVALAAAYLPARRAATIDPAAALRQE